jgi:hypothetical protein
MLADYPFGSIKQWMEQGVFLTRGLANVRAEFTLTALARVTPSFTIEYRQAKRSKLENAKLG